MKKFEGEREKRKEKKRKKKNMKKKAIGMSFIVQKLMLNSAKNAEFSVLRFKPFSDTH